MVSERNHPDGLILNLKNVKVMIQNKNKGGRPKKSLGEKKTYRINLKLGTEEYYSLLSKVKKAGITKSEFIRSCLKKGYIKERLSSEIVGYIRDISGMANNLNQLARQANAQGYTAVREQISQFAERFDNLLNKLGV